MPVQGLAKVTAPPQKEWIPVPEDVYQVVISDITERDGKKYKSDEDIVQYFFKFIILDEGEQHKQMLTAYFSTSWFSGNKGMNPSKLVTIFKAVYGFYFPGVSVAEMSDEEADKLMQQNILIGAQLKITVKMTDDKTGNKVTDFMSIKKELPIPEDVKIEGEFKLKAEKPATAPTAAVASSENSSNPDDFIKSLEEDQKKEEELAEKLSD